MNPNDLNQFDFSNFPASMLGKLEFKIKQPTQPPLPAGAHFLGVHSDKHAEMTNACTLQHKEENKGDRDTLLIVPEGLPKNAPVPLFVMFHGANGNVEKVRHFFEDYAKTNHFLLMFPQSVLPTWDLTIGGHGPDLERLEKALSIVSDHFQIDPNHFAFAGFSDGASYALSTGITNGLLVSHVIVFSGGFMNVYQKEGKPLVFIAHSPEDEQLNIRSCGLKHYNQLKKEGYPVFFEMFSGRHVIHPPVVQKAMEFFLKKSPNRS